MSVFDVLITKLNVYYNIMHRMPIICIVNGRVSENVSRAIE